jgi:hypothetical protein
MFRLMKSVKNLLGGRRNSTRARKHNASLALETLEDRSVPAILFTPEFGAESVAKHIPSADRLHNPKVYLIFWGASAWGDGNGNLNAAATARANAANNFLSGPYTSGLARYDTNIGAPSLAGMALDPDEPGATFTQSELKDVVDSADDFGLPEPGDVDNALYVVVTPNGTFDSTNSQAVGYHSIYTDVDWAFAFPHWYISDISDVPYGWVGSFGGGVDEFTTTLSHEVVEASTNPDTDSPTFVVGAGNAWSFGGDDELADREAQNYTYRVSGSLVQSYWYPDLNAQNQYLTSGSYIVPDGTTNQNFIVVSKNGSRTLMVNGDQVGSADNIVVDVTPLGGARITLNSYVGTFEPGAISGIVVTPGTGINIVTVQKTNVPVTINGTAFDLITVGNSGSVKDIKAAVTVNETSTIGQLIVDSSADANKQVAQVTGNSITGLGTINYNMTSGNSLTIKTGAGDDVVNVSGTSVYTQVLGNAFNQVNVGGTSTLGILGEIFVDNIGGTTQLTVSDTDDFKPRIVTITDGRIQGLTPETAAITYNGLRLSSLTVNGGFGKDPKTNPGGSGGNFYYVKSTPGLSDGHSSLNVPVTINGNLGDDIFVVGSLGDSTSSTLDLILGSLTVNGGAGNNSLTLQERGGATGHTYSLSSISNSPATDRLTRSGIAGISYRNVQTVSLLANQGDDTVNVKAPTPQLPITVYGGKGVDQLAGANASNTWTINAINAGKLESAGSKVTFDSFENLYGGSMEDLFKFAVGGALGGTVKGGLGGSNKLDYSAWPTPATVHLTGPAAGTATAVNWGFSQINAVVGSQTSSDSFYALDAMVNDWTLAGNNFGQVAANNGNQLVDVFYFSGVERLFGGTDVDTFQFLPMPGVQIANLDGGGGGNWLDYSLYTSAMPVDVNLATGLATNVINQVVHIQNVIGGQGNDNLVGNIDNILVGGAGEDHLRAVAGNNVLIGGLGADVVEGGLGDDLLLGGWTTYDASSDLNRTALMTLAKVWQSPDSLLNRVNQIQTGVNGFALTKLNAPTVFDDNLAADTVTGGPGLDFFFAYAGDTASADIELSA